MSDQNQWPKPGETEPGRDASVGGQPQSQVPGAGQYGASAPEAPAAPEAPSAPASDPWAQSGQGAAAQGVSEGHTAPQNPYGAPTQQQNPYVAPGQQQNPYAAPGQQQNPYAAPGQQQNPYAQNPYAAPQNQYAQNPYAAPQNQYAQNPYAAPGYSAAGYQPYAQRPKTNTLAVLSIVFGLGAVPLFVIAILLGPAGAILGHIALGKIKENGEGGRGLALTGIIAGWVMAGFWILWIIGLVWLGTIGSSYSDNYDYGTDSGAFIG